VRVRFGPPQELRESLAGQTRAALVTRCARLRPGDDLADPSTAAKTGLRRFCAASARSDPTAAKAVLAKSGR
jgi:hypothetical protein